MRYTVEFKGPKGWEISYEGENGEEALAVYEDIVQDTKLDPQIAGARLTAEQV